MFLIIYTLFYSETLTEDKIYKELMSKALEDKPFQDVGITIVSGSNLPRHSDHHRCFLRGSTIKVNKSNVYIVYY